MSATAQYTNALTALRERAQTARTHSILELFSSEPDRLARFGVDAAGLHLDMSKSLMSEADLQAMVAFSRVNGVDTRRDAQLRGERVNATEERAALHTALRRDPARPLIVDGVDLMQEVGLTLERMRQFSRAVRNGQWRGATGELITDIVNIGIGGSQLGPLLACEAMREYAHPRLRVHFLANVDPDSWNEIAKVARPGSTLAVVASKSWSTPETARNAQAVRRWLVEGGVPEASLSRHLVGVTANAAGARAFGLSDEGIFPFRDWVGGRFSMWSAIGLPVMLLAGPEAFDQMLEGAREMDEHFVSTPVETNAPVRLALLSAWNRLVLPGATEPVIPYCEALRRLPAYLQQQQMESNGKSVDMDGDPVVCDTASVVWGEAGTDAQHSFFQALHQGTAIHPVEFVVPVPSAADPDGRGNALLANALAQAEGLLRGRSEQACLDELLARGVPAPRAATLARHRALKGNRPSTTILLSRLTPHAFGALVALYEHKTAVLGWLWRINSYDQWGVELGKTLAARAEALIDGREQPSADLDASTADLVHRIRRVLAAR